jgi:hypothetical protein
MDMNTDDDGIPVDVYARLMGDLSTLTAEWENRFDSMVETQSDGGTLLSMVFATELKSSVV